jgi:hypothetical protein
MSQRTPAAELVSAESLQVQEERAHLLSLQLDAHLQGANQAVLDTIQATFSFELWSLQRIALIGAFGGFVSIVLRIHDFAVRLSIHETLKPPDAVLRGPGPAQPDATPRR